MIIPVNEFKYPEIIDIQSTTTSLLEQGGTQVAYIQSSTNKKVGCVFNCPQSGNITSVMTYIPTVTTVGDTPMTVGLYTVDATTGFASASLVNAGASATVSPSAGLNLITFTTPATVVKGTNYAFIYDATASVVTPWNINHWQKSSSINGTQMPYWQYQATGTDTKSSARGVWLPFFRYQDGTIPRVAGGMGMYNSVVNSFNSGTNPGDECGMRFKLPFSCRVSGFSIYMDIVGATPGNSDIIIYDAAGTVVASTVDKDIVASTSSGQYNNYFSSSVILSANTEYRIAVKPLTTSNSSLWKNYVPDYTYLSATPGGAEWYWTSRTDGGAWTDDKNYWAYMSLIIDGIVAGNSSASVI